MRDQHNKMSKRHGDPSYEDLIAQGFLTDAVLNYVALLGWSPEGEQEIFSLDELVKVFDLKRISKSPAIFDIEKLRYFNSEYIRALPPEKFAELAKPYIEESAGKNVDYKLIAALLQQRCEVLNDIPEKVDFFGALPDYDCELFVHKKSKTNREISLTMLKEALPMLESLGSWSQDAIHDGLISLAEKLEVKNATLMWPVRIAVSGKAVTPGGAVEICHILGKAETIRRIKTAIEKL